MLIRFLADFTGTLLVGPVWGWRQHRRRPGDAFSGCSTRSEDFYTATSGDILLAIREDFYMAMDTRRLGAGSAEEEFRIGAQPQCWAPRLIVPEKCRCRPRNWHKL